MRVCWDVPLRREVLWLALTRDRPNFALGGERRVVWAIRASDGLQWMVTTEGQGGPTGVEIWPRMSLSIWSAAGRISCRSRILGSSVVALEVAIVHASKCLGSHGADFVVMERKEGDSKAGEKHLFICDDVAVGRGKRRCLDVVVLVWSLNF